MLEPLSLFNLVLTLALLIGGIVAYRHGLTRSAHEIQERVIHALQSEIQTLYDRIELLEEENTRLEQTIATICSALKQRGLQVSIDGDLVRIQERPGGDYTYMARLHDSEPLAMPTEPEKAIRRRGRKAAKQETEE